jgi:hypothetical protein
MLSAKSIYWIWNKRKTQLYPHTNGLLFSNGPMSEKIQARIAGAPGLP